MTLKKVTHGRILPSLKVEPKTGGSKTGDSSDSADMARFCVSGASAKAGHRVLTLEPLGEVTRSELGPLFSEPTSAQVGHNQNDEGS